MLDTSPPANARKSQDKSRPDADPCTKHNKHSSNFLDKLSLHKLGGWLKREESEEPPPEDAYDAPLPSGPERVVRPGLLGRRTSGRQVVPGLPRPITFRRQQSEKREKLCPVESERERASPRARSASRATSSRLSGMLSLPSVSLPSRSAPDVRFADESITPGAYSDRTDQPKIDLPLDDDNAFRGSIGLPTGEPLPLPPISANGDLSDHDTASDAYDDRLLQQELEAKWILNLSMHFRDMSDREKFFITYAEEPNKWRRVTVSCDYRNITPESLEADLKSLHYQRDKSARIYDSIRESLPDIQFYDTVTNLKLQTDDGRLHVHVTEDVNEIVPYPTVASVAHLPGPRFAESAVHFESHISGFVYKVTAGGKTYIKKEIPGPETVEEFLYEIHALCSLQGAQSVVKYEGLVISDSGDVVKGLLISYAEQGALVDIVFDYKEQPEELPWPRRERWAKQIVQGLSEIHEGGYVQGDFTLSNIVVDGNDDAKIIDINRRGCPVGWEPPELSDLIEKGHRISIYIGVKSDIFQLGMVLWALMEKQDEPERQERPLRPTGAGRDVPRYFEDMVYACLQPLPRNRPSAKDLLSRFPAISDEHAKPLGTARHSVSTHHSESDKVYIDPKDAVGLQDIEDSRRRGSPGFRSANEVAFVDDATTTSYRYSSGYSVMPGRSGSPTSASALTNPSRHQYDYSPKHRASSTSLRQSDLSAMAQQPEGESLWEAVDIDNLNRNEPQDSLLTLRTASTIKDDERLAAIMPTTSELGPQDQSQDWNVQASTSAPAAPRHGEGLGVADTQVLERIVEHPTSSVPPPPRRSLDYTQPSPTKSKPPPPLFTPEPPVSADSHRAPESPAVASLTPRTLQRRAHSLDWPTQNDPLDVTAQSSPSRRSTGGGGSFQTRIHSTDLSNSRLASLETEVLSVPTPLPRAETEIFGPPLHHDSGFHEGTPTSANTDLRGLIEWEKSKLEEELDDPQVKEQREQRRRMSAELDELRAREGLQRILRSVSGNLGKAIIEEGDEVDDSSRRL